MLETKAYCISSICSGCALLRFTHCFQLLQSGVYLLCLNRRYTQPHLFRAEDGKVCVCIEFIWSDIWNQSGRLYSMKQNKHETRPC